MLIHSLKGSKESTYSVDYQTIKKDSSLSEGRSYFYEWVNSYLDEKTNSLIINELNSFEAVFTESSSRFELATEHSFPKSLANALYHAAKSALEEGLSKPAIQLFYALSHLLPNNYDVFFRAWISFPTTRQL